MAGAKSSVGQVHGFFFFRLRYGVEGCELTDGDERVRAKGRTNSVPSFFFEFGAINN